MADIPTFSPTGSIVSPSNLYDESIYKPETPGTARTTFETLNGGLDSDNFDSATSTVPTYAVQRGSFARGEFLGFDKWEFQYHYQSGQENSKENWLPHASLAHRFFLPWDASVVMFGFQAFFRHDCSAFHPKATTFFRERWHVQTLFDGSDIQELGTQLTYTRGAKTSAGIAAGPTTPVIRDGRPTNTDLFPSEEQRWRWVCKSAMKKDISKGYHNVQVSVWPYAFPWDSDSSKWVYPNWFKELYVTGDWDLGVTNNPSASGKKADMSGEDPAVKGLLGLGSQPVIPEDVKLVTPTGGIWVLALR